MGMRSRVLYTASSASPQSGAFRILLAMVRGIESEGFEALMALPAGKGPYSLLSPSEQDRSLFLDLPQAKTGQGIAYHTKYLLRNARSILQLSNIVRREDVSIVHPNEIFDLYAPLAAKMARVQCVWHIRADLSPWPIAQWFLPRIANLYADAILAVSQSVRYHAFEAQGIDASKVAVIYDPGPNPLEFHPSVDGSAVRDEFQLDRDAFLVTLVAKIARRKGHEVFIRAAPKVLAEFSNTSFMIVGGELGGRHHQLYAKELKALPQELGIADRTIFTGFRSDIPKIMSASDIVVHCSIYPDPFPGVVLQGMSVGKPVVASDLGGPREQIEHGISGLLVEPQNPSKLADAICTLLASRERRESLGNKAVRRVRSKFTSDLYFERLVNLYDSHACG
jgi:glycosyltransferase involved in cell wall biosynthesis